MLGGRKDEELEDCYGFIVENNVNELQTLVVNGIQVRLLKKLHNELTHAFL